MNPSTRSNNYHPFKLLIALSLILVLTAASLPSVRAADFTVADDAELITAIDAVNAANAAMVFTGRRHFRH